MVNIHIFWLVSCWDGELAVMQKSSMQDPAATTANVSINGYVSFSQIAT
jgi:hypothetical protein